MHWLLYFAISLITAGLGLVGGGWIGSVCVRWYRISSFEGGSGYFVIGIALLGALVGLVTGLITAGILAPVTGADYLRSAGWSALAALGLAVIVLALCWVFADIRPTIDTTESPAEGAGDSSPRLSSVVNQGAGGRDSGEIPPADATLSAWFPYVGSGAREDRRAVALTRLLVRPQLVREITELMMGEVADQAAEALRLVEHLPPEMTADLVEPSMAVGRNLVERIRKVNVTTAEQDPSYVGAADASIRFNAWMVAVRSLRVRGQGDFVPELGAILELSRVRPDSHVMRQDICRVASFYLQEWAGVAPLPTDPKPR